jgi:hypothetical protein
VFSAVGYETQEISVAGRSTIDVTMQLSNNKLDEVVVVGYGSQEKRNVTGAISSLDEKYIREILKDRNILDTSKSGKSGDILVSST